MWNRLRDWLQQVGKPRFEGSLHEVRTADDELKRRLQAEIDRLSRELEATAANMRGTPERFND